MSDLVQRLRYVYGDSVIREEAAQEIERLRARVAELEQKDSVSLVVRQMKRIAELESMLAAALAPTKGGER